MKKAYSILLMAFLFISFSSIGENNKIDSLIIEIQQEKVDSNKIKLLDKLTWNLMFSQPDTALQISKTALKLSKGIKDTLKIIDALNSIATAHAVMGEYSNAFQYFNKAREIAELKNMAKSLSKIYNNLGLVQWYRGELDSAIILYNNAIEQYNIALKQDDKKQNISVGVANTNNNLGLIYKSKGEKDLAIEHYEKALFIFDSLGRKDISVANTINNLGVVIYEKGNLPLAMEHYLKALKIYENVNDQSSTHANTLVNIGNLYKEQEEYDDALNYYRLAEAMQKKISKQSVALANTYGAIGGIYTNLIEEEKAIEYLKKALEIQEAVGEKTNGMAEVLLNLGQLYMDKRKNYIQAGVFFNRALQTYKDIGDRSGIATTYYYLGFLDIKQGNYTQAISKCKKSYQFSLELDLLRTRQLSCECLGIAYESKNNPSKALFYYKLFINSRDSLTNRENTRAITQKKMRYEFEKTQYQDSLKRAEEAKLRALERREADLKKEEEIKRQRTYAVSGGIGFILMFGLAFVLFRGYQNKQRSNDIISAQKAAVERQKFVIEEKNKEILDSISYAQRIQNIILPDQALLNEKLGENFVFFRPKDIVSGDFYWFSQYNDDLFFSVIDCTGHGVPGALVSIVANNSLNQVLNEDKIKIPAVILDYLNKHVEEHFSSTSGSINDGMDLALCKLNRPNMELEYAGANNPVYIIRHSPIIDKELEKITKRIMISKDKNKVLYEIQADKQPIGKYEYRKPFKNHKIKVQEGDRVYIFSDGFADQFGGDKGKKYMYKPFKKLLMDNSSLSMIDQKRNLEKTFDDWKMDMEQVDDVCVMGMII